MFKRFNDGVARGEAAMATCMLAPDAGGGVCAGPRCATWPTSAFAWANAGLEQIDWADFILTKGTLWLAFLGASLAVHANKHVAIDIVPRYLPPRGRTASARRWSAWSAP